MRRWAWISVFAVACVPRPHNPLGRTCDQASDCGGGYVCWQGRCAVAGSVGEVPLDATSLSMSDDEGALRRSDAGLHRAANQRATLEVWGLAGELPAGRRGHRVTPVGSTWVLTGGADAVGPSTQVWTLSDAADGGLGAWQPSSPLPEARTQHAACAAGGRLFVVGGSDGQGAARPSVWAAPVSAQGTLGAWTAEGALPTALEGATCLGAAGAVWVIGGSAASGLSSQVWVSRLRPDGALGPWTVAANLPAGRTHHAAVLRVGSVFVVGGRCSTGPCEPLSAALDVEGTLGTFQSWPGGPSPREFAAVADVAGNVVVAGGRTAAGVDLAEVWSASLGAGGVVGGWHQLGALSAPVSHAAPLVRDANLSLLGGERSGTTLRETWTAAARDSLAVSTFSRVAPLPGPRAKVASAVWAGRVYVMGGELGGDVLTRSVISAEVQVSSLGPWVDAGVLPSLFRDGEAVGLNGFLYVMGGVYTGPFSGAEAGVWGSAIREDGTLGSFANTTPLPLERQNFGATVAQGRVYVAGGRVSETAVGATNVWVNQPNADGGLGAWIESTPLPNPLAAHRLVAARNHLYALGGATGSPEAYSNKVWSAPLAVDGTVGPWSAEPSFQTPRALLGAAVIDDALLIFGGCNDGVGSFCENFLTDVQQAELTPSGKLSVWRTLTATVDGRRDFGNASVGGRVWMLGGRKFGPLGFVEAAEVAGPFGLGLWQPLPALPAAFADATFLSGAGRAIAFGGHTGAVVSLGTPRGAPTAWQVEPSLPAPLRGVAGAASASRVYVLGGDEAGAASARVFSASVATTQVAAWREENSLPQPVRRGCAAVDRKFLFALGGENTANVWVATLGDDGELGAWRTARGLPIARWQHSCVVAGHRVYVLAGTSAQGPVTEVSWAALADDGSLGDWQRATTLKEGRVSAAATVQDGWVYLVGGSVNGRATGDVLCAPFEADGALGDFIALPQRIEPRAGPGLAAIDGWLLVGGGTSNAPLNSASAAPLRPPNARAAFSVRADLGFTATGVDSLQVTVSTALAGPLRLGVRASGENERVEPFRPLGFLEDTGRLSVGGAARYVWLYGELDERLAAARQPSPPSRVTGVDVSYRR